MNPGKRTIKLPSTVNKTRAIPSGTFVRTSHRLRSIFSTNGIPSGHPYCTVLMSPPIAFLCCADNDLNHFRTGSVPELARKKTTRSLTLIGSIYKNMHHNWYNSQEENTQGFLYARNISIERKMSGFPFLKRLPELLGRMFTLP